MPDPRLFLEEDLNAGASLALDEDQARYLTQVLRLKPGARVRVFNGRDGEWEGAIVEAGRRGAALNVGAQLRPQTLASTLHLLFSPLKRHATDWLVEKATELGVGVLQPVMAKRTVAETVRTDRLVAIAREAAEQTERLDVPEVREPITLARVVDGWPKNEIRSRALIYADEAGDDAAKPWAERRGVARLCCRRSLRCKRMLSRC